MSYKEELAKKYKRGVSLADIKSIQETPKENSEKDEISYLKKLEKAVKDMLWIWDNYRLDEKRLNKAMIKVIELVKRRRDGLL